MFGSVGSGDGEARLAAADAVPVAQADAAAVEAVARPRRGADVLHACR